MTKLNKIHKPGLRVQIICRFHSHWHCHFHWRFVGTHNLNRNFELGWLESLKVKEECLPMLNHLMWSNLLSCAKKTTTHYRHCVNLFQSINWKYKCNALLCSIFLKTYYPAELTNTCLLYPCIFSTLFRKMPKGIGKLINKRILSWIRQEIILLIDTQSNNYGNCWKECICQMIEGTKDCQIFKWTPSQSLTGKTKPSTNFK